MGTAASRGGGKGGAAGGARARCRGIVESQVLLMMTVVVVQLATAGRSYGCD